MTKAAFDFRKPPPGELERQLAQWLTLASRQASTIWTKSLPFPADVKAGPVSAVTGAIGANSLADDALAIPVTSEVPADGTILLAVPRPMCLALFAGLLGETPDKVPLDRPFTDVETSLLGYLIRELFLTPLEAGWPAADRPTLSAGKPGLPRVVWRMPPGDPVLSAVLNVSLPFGEHVVQLLVPRAGRWEQLAAGDPRGKSVPPAPREQLEALVRDMQVDLDVVLGTADLSMHELTRLRAGDLVVLQQKVSQPLEGLVAGTLKFQVWPGVVGTRTAALIHAVESPI
jgi:flagellar motor switch protein FliM